MFSFTHIKPFRLEHVEPILNFTFASQEGNSFIGLNKRCNKLYTNYYKRTKMIDYTLNCIEKSMQHKMNYFYIQNSINTYNP